ncbi:SDR family oxidoreductase [Leucobacter soli]|uniref:SDR family oxidoreductase n=1 Tax=Leucobacter soli TaxID=2812850 RepID=UPI003614C634
MTGEAEPGLVVAGHLDDVAEALLRLAVSRGWRVAFIGTEHSTRLCEVGVQMHVADLADSVAIEALLSNLTSQWGRAPIAVVHIGHLERTRPAVIESSEGWDAFQNEQLRAGFVLAQAGAREMLRLRGGAPVDDGAVVLVGEASAARGLPGHPQTVAGAALAGLAGMTRQLAVEWGRLGIRVNMVEAGIVGPDSEQDFDVLRRVPSPAPAPRRRSRRLATISSAGPRLT